MKKILIVLTVTGAAAAIFTIYLNQQKKNLHADHSQNMDEHQTMFDHFGWVQTT
ncbi:MAG: hypothetical protein ACR2FN_11120 [Chitinophagaceae bacterium]